MWIAPQTRLVGRLAWRRDISVCTASNRYGHSYMFSDRRKHALCNDVIPRRKKNLSLCNDVIPQREKNLSWHNDVNSPTKEVSAFKSNRQLTKISVPKQPMSNSKQKQCPIPSGFPPDQRGSMDIITLTKTAHNGQINALPYNFFAFLVRPALCSLLRPRFLLFTITAPFLLRGRNKNRYFSRLHIHQAR